MDCCAPKNDDTRNDETTKNAKQEDSHHARGGFCGENPWMIVVVAVLFVLFLILTKG